MSAHHPASAATSAAAAQAVGLPSHRDVFVAHQPIFDTHQKVFAYELLFRRAGGATTADVVDGDAATRQTINAAVNVVGLTDVTAGRPAFFNITRGLLVSDFYRMLPRGLTVVELLENIPVDAEVVSACRRVREAGYTLALDDFVLDHRNRELLAIADIVKIDFTISDLAARRSIIEQHRRPGLAFLAEKVETVEDFEQARRLGYSYFQGYFFCRPQTLSAREISSAKRACLNLLQQVTKPDLEYTEVEETIRGEVGLSVKLLKYFNSASIGLRSKVASIKQALALLGETELRHWAAIVAMTSLGDDKPDELARTCLVRAGFCERLGPMLKLGVHELDLFLLGLLSGLDAMLDKPMADLLTQLPISADVKGALLGGPTPLGKVLMLATACERGDFKRAAMLAKLLALDDARLNEALASARKWADHFFA